MHEQSKDKECGTCRFFNNSGHCCLNPPVLVTNYKSNKPEGTWRFPMVLPAHWCGKWTSDKGENNER